MQKAHPRSRIPKFRTDSTGKDFLRYEALYQDRKGTAEIVRTTWQEWDMKDVALAFQGESGLLVDLVLADPFYGEKWQPTLKELPLLRKLFDQISKENTVFIIFGRPDALCSLGPCL